MLCLTSIPPSRWQTPFLCACDDCGNERAVIDGHVFEQLPDQPRQLKCVVCGFRTHARARYEPLELHAVYCFPRPEDNPDLPREARDLGIRTAAEALAMLDDVDPPKSVIDWLWPESPVAKEIRAMCVDLLRAATTTLSTGVPGQRLFRACRRALQRERRVTPLALHVKPRSLWVVELQECDGTWTPSTNAFASKAEARDNGNFDFAGAPFRVVRYVPE